MASFLLPILYWHFCNKTGCLSHKKHVCILYILIYSPDINLQIFSMLVETKQVEPIIYYSICFCLRGLGNKGYPVDSNQIFLCLLAICLSQSPPEPITPVTSDYSFPTWVSKAVTLRVLCRAVRTKKPERALSCLLLSYGGSQTYSHRGKLCM